MTAVPILLVHDTTGVWLFGASSRLKDDPKDWPKEDDGWTDQLFQRDKLLGLLESLHKPAFVLTGDLHKSFVARITPGVYDIATGPHTSGNHRLGDAGCSPPRTSGCAGSAFSMTTLPAVSN